MTKTQTIEDFIEESMFGKNGYYTTGANISKTGDFITSINISSLFAESVAMFLVSTFFSQPPQPTTQTSQQSTNQSTNQLNQLTQPKAKQGQSVQPPHPTNQISQQSTNQLNQLTQPESKQSQSVQSRHHTIQSHHRTTQPAQPTPSLHNYDIEEICVKTSHPSHPSNATSQLKNLANANANNNSTQPLKTHNPSINVNPNNKATKTNNSTSRRQACGNQSQHGNRATQSTQPTNKPANPATLPTPPTQSLKKFNLCEIGGGNGQTMLHIIKTLQKLNLTQHINAIYMVDCAEGMLQKQKDTLKTAQNNASYPIHFCKNINDAEDGTPILVFNNELLDAIPIVQIKFTNPISSHQPSTNISSIGKHGNGDGACQSSSIDSKQSIIANNNSTQTLKTHNPSINVNPNNQSSANSPIDKHGNCSTQPSNINSHVKTSATTISSNTNNPLANANNTKQHATTNTQSAVITSVKPSDERLSQIQQFLKQYGYPTPRPTQQATAHPTQPQTQQLNTPQTQNEILELPIKGVSLFAAICNKVKKNGGVMLTIDYGENEFTTKSTLQCLKAHKQTSILQNIAEQDITHAVQFNIFKQVSQNAGLNTYNVINQSEFLKTCGIETRIKQAKFNTEEEKQQANKALQRLTSTSSKTDMGSLFKVLIATS